MRILLDTCTLLWLVSAPAHLSESARRAISAGAGSVFVSAISAWEIGIKSGSGKLLLPQPAPTWFAGVLQHHGLEEVPVNGSTAIASTLLPRLHNDPADRLIIATALEMDLTLVTPDKHIAQYPMARVLW